MNGESAVTSGRIRAAEDAEETWEGHYHGKERQQQHEAGQGGKPGKGIMGFEARIITSTGTEFFQQATGHFHHRPHQEFNLVSVYPAVRRQRLVGFGGAFTEAAAYVYAQLDQAQRAQLTEAYFGPTGIGYALGRTTIQSCDFALGTYCYTRRFWDRKLRHFNLERDQRWVLPFLRDAVAAQPSLTFLASPWSPPSFMKSNRTMALGGHLRPRYRARWAHMMARYVAEYRTRGINITRLTMQNEPEARQTWESCLVTAQEELALAAEVRRALDQAGLSDVRMLCWDHNKDRMIRRLTETFGGLGIGDRAGGGNGESASVGDGRDGQVAPGAAPDGDGTKAMQPPRPEPAATPSSPTPFDGVAFHWYTGDHFEALQACTQAWPQLEFLMTEGCVEFSREDANDQLRHAQHYAHDIMGDLNAGAHGWIDWNLLLDHRGGPNHVGNFCGAPVQVSQQGQLIFHPSFAYIGHFSRYIKPGAVRLLTSRCRDEVEATAFANPDGTFACVLLNRTDWQQEFELFVDGHVLECCIPAKGIQTICWQ